MILYLECYYGISGDMTVASLLDLGASKEKLLNTLKELNISDEFEVKISKVNKYGLPMKITKREGEFITPTGVAIAATIKNMSELPEKYIIKKVGLGAGKKYPNVPSILRAMLIEEN